MHSYMKPLDISDRLAVLKAEALGKAMFCGEVMSETYHERDCFDHDEYERIMDEHSDRQDAHFHCCHIFELELRMGVKGD